MFQLLIEISLSFTVTIKKAERTIVFNSVNKNQQRNVTQFEYVINQHESL